jgi:hypothetical protein
MGAACSASGCSDDPVLRTALVVIAVLCSPNVPRTATAPAGGGTGTLDGSVTNDVGATAVPDGEVWLYNPSDTTVVGTISVDGSGNYSDSGIAAGNYRLRYQAPAGFSLGATEPDYRDVTVTSGGTTTQDFAAQASVWTRDMRNLSASQSTVISYSGSPGAGTVPPPVGSIFRSFPAVDSVNYGGAVEAAGGSTYGDIDSSLDGPSGVRCLRYTWDHDGNGIAYNANPQGSSSVFVASQARANPYPGGTDTEFWFSWQDKYSANWRCGGNGATGSSAEYKVLFLDFHTGRSFTLEFENAGAGGILSNALSCRLKMLGGVIAVTDPDPLADGWQSNDWVPSAGALLDTWQHWAMCLKNLGTSSITGELWHNGIKRLTLTTDFLSGSGLSFISNIMTAELGANINNGPDTADGLPQYRWWDYVQFTRTRPGMYVRA